MRIVGWLPTQSLCGILALAVLFACPVQLATDTGAQSEDGAMLRIGFLQGIDSLNPFMCLNESALVFRSLVYDYLVALDQDLQPKPNLATSWCIVDAYEPYGSVWQYNLTQNAYWHDDEPLDADDVVFTFEYQTDEWWTVLWQHQPYTLLVDHVEKVDSYTVRLFFAKEGEPIACSYGDSLMIPIIPEHVWSNIHPVEAGFSYENPFPIGSGPFKCTEWTYDEHTSGEGITLYTNDRYHGGPEYGIEVQFDGLTLKAYPEREDLLGDLQNGSLDIAQLDAIGHSMLEDWLYANPSDEIQANSMPMCTGASAELGICVTEAVGLNNLRRDFEVRKAMAHATNRSSIVDHIYRGLGEIGSTTLSPVYSNWYWEPEGDEVYEYDLALANDILDAAGYLWYGDHSVRYAPPEHPWNDAGEDLELRFEMIVKEDIVEDRATAQFLVEEWAEIGIRIVPVYVDAALWGTLVYGCHYDTMLTSLSADPDPNRLLWMQSTEALGGWSQNWYSNPEYDENYTASVLETDPEERRVYVENCQRHVYRDNAFIVYAYPHDCYGLRTDRFSGWGDWSAHPGRAFSNRWTANDLYFALAPEDASPPTTSAEVDGVTGENGWYRSNVTVTLEATDDSGSVDRTQYSLDGPEWFTYEGPITIAGDGLHSMEFYSVDDQGVCEQHRTLDIAIDTIDPAIHIDTEEGTTFAVDEVNISWECSDMGSGIEAVEYSFDGHEYEPCDRGYVVLTEVAEGEHSIAIRAYDEAGNNDSDTIQFSVDIPGDDGTDLALVAASAAAVAIAAVALLYVVWRRKPEPPLIK